MRTYIRINDEVRREILADFGITDRALWKILHFLSGSNRADSIRQFALSHGGTLVTERTFNTSTVFHDKAAGTMVYKFPNDVAVVISKKDSSAVIQRYGAEVEKYESLDTSGWGNLLFRANEISMQASI